MFTRWNQGHALAHGAWRWCSCLPRVTGLRSVVYCDTMSGLSAQQSLLYVQLAVVGFSHAVICVALRHMPSHTGIGCLLCCTQGITLEKDHSNRHRLECTFLC